MRAKDLKRQRYLYAQKRIKKIVEKRQIKRRGREKGRSKQSFLLLREMSEKRFRYRGEKSITIRWT